MNNLTDKNFQGIAPCINLNGTSPECLVRQKRSVLDKVGELLIVLEDAEPHGRDFLQGGGTAELFKAAQAEHRNRMKVLFELKKVLLDELEAIYEGKRGILLTENDDAELVQPTRA